MNKVLLIGRIASDIDYKQISDRKSIARARIAVERQMENNRSDYIPLTFWDSSADYVHKFVPKGTLVHIEGRYTTGSYIDKVTNKTIYTTDVTVDRIEILETKETVEKRKNNLKDHSVQSNAVDFSNSNIVFGEDLIELDTSDLPE
ncbi:single-stranded DNA-binding protein [Mycoplasma phocimorsus]|uniref:single-stranded DNA-binding protein n=1 Tax=Mycoplasma phocimorsus TaxID=3045839 RepID=UPI0024BFD993|nr:single-stranded DNA-binding protein [Mycoplasma phocimorsus]MDJ1646163.1 single-stranded DNA-binding protein [Mycoplasma phocimorsus]MDJ1646760.1 single-stranded DNA-binding protein [Mycoplasma phocimorsus]MDJ1647735.1 single-stranded DNA-binding protein [Mycoplasma phocimorsus]MDJ1648269.1 single-stranded DNA-binding protein [Mycoplasma phocimorsus]